MYREKVLTTISKQYFTAQVLLDSHGEVAARICSILRVNGHLEAEAIAEKAMVPAKDTREVRDRKLKSEDNSNVRTS